MKKGENIYKRKDGRWEARYKKGYSSNGKMKYGYVYGKTYNEARAKRTEKLAHIKTSFNEEKMNKSGKNLDMLANQFLAKRREFVKESTYAKYKLLYEKHIAPQFGEVDLTKLDVNAVVKFIVEKQKTIERNGLSPKTVSDIMSVLKLIIVEGVKAGDLTDCSIIVKQTKKYNSDNKAGQVPIFLPNEIAKLEEFLRVEDGIGNFCILLTMYTGIRIGELCALRWHDIDLENGLINIAYTIQRLHDYSLTANSKTHLVLSTPKTYSSRRTIPLCTFLIEGLRRYKTSSESFVLSGSEKPVEPRTFFYFYKRQLAKCGLQDHTFHAIRHTFATRCIESGVDVKSLSEILGHSNINITMNRYVHPSMEVKRQYLEQLAKEL